MIIAYIMYPGACYNGKADGTRMQAQIWKTELEKRGHQVDYISPWGNYDWKKYDVIHVFGLGLWMYDLIYWGSRLRDRFVYSPIIDSNTPLWKYRLASLFGCRKLRMISQNYAVRLLRNDIRLFLARTDYEAQYLRRGYDIEKGKIGIVPLSYRADNYNPSIKKEQFCLFVGTMTQERKNVKSLILAAKKYGFQLVLAGNKGNEESQKKLYKLIDGAENIQVKGFVSDEELALLYNKAKVFALPSLNEGVGLVALEAAVCGCNIVITNLGGPKEYYPDALAYKVNPLDIDDIGKSIMTALNDNDSQPKLREHIISNYNNEKCIDLLERYYSKVGL